MDSKWFWIVQIILAEFQLFWTCLIKSNLFWLGPNHFEKIQVIKFGPQNLIWTWPNIFLSSQNDLDVTKTTCTRPKQFGLSKIILEGQGITTMLYINF